MPKLWKARLGEDSDEADGPDLSVAHQELEAALGGIFGIKDKVEISEAVFSSPDVSSPVTADGEIWMLRYKSEQPVPSIWGASGIQFYDENEKKRLVLVNSKIQIFKELADGSWENVIDLELVEEPEISEYEDITDEIRNYNGVGKVIAVSADEDIFTLVDDAVPESGAQVWHELADVEDVKWIPPYTGGTTYRPEIVGHCAMVGATEKIWPGIALDDSGFMFWAKTPPRVVAGDDTWVLLSHWEFGAESHEDATVVDRTDQYPNADFQLTPGVYKVDFKYSVTSSSGMYGRTQFQVGCVNCHQWPTQTFRVKAKHFYFDNPGPTDPPPLEETLVRWIDTAEDAPGVDEGPVFVVVPGNDATISVAIKMLSGWGFMCRPTLSVSRIN